MTSVGGDGVCTCSMTLLVVMVCVHVVWPVLVVIDGVCTCSMASVSGDGVCTCSMATVGGDGVCTCSMASVGGDDGEDGDGKKRHEAWRRYSEFEALRQFLCAVYPHIVVPPLPEKDVSYYSWRPACECVKKHFALGKSLLSFPRAFMSSR